MKTANNDFSDASYPEVAKLTKEYRSKQGLSLRNFAMVLCSSLPGGDISHETVNKWEQGVSRPDRWLLVSIVMTYSDWRFDFGMDLLESTAPETFADLKLSMVKEMNGGNK